LLFILVHIVPAAGICCQESGDKEEDKVEECLTARAEPALVINGLHLLLVLLL
jgi:hypothetical protein